jgi:KipI family sensor histidine kinase inhibitor
MDANIGRTVIYDKLNFRVMGDRAFLVELGEEISCAINKKVRELFVSLDQQRLAGVIDLIPSYRSLLVIYDPLQTTMSKLEKQIVKIQKGLDPARVPSPKTVKIPVIYGNDYGPDLEWVAAYHKITPQEVIRIHTGHSYQVYMIGFTSGFPYLGEVPEALSTPRRETPRIHVPKGSVAIAQKQTGIYPVQSPGGWHIIGWTPVTLFDPQADPPSLLEMGDQVKFQAITAEEMENWQV